MLLCPLVTKNNATGRDLLPNKVQNPKLVCAMVPGEIDGSVIVED
jgi:hypothetical protein